ncbi:hypothetical protein Dimus_037012, partial [Dionaea muscipula]
GSLRSPAARHERKITCDFPPSTKLIAAGDEATAASDVPAARHAHACCSSRGCSPPSSPHDVRRRQREVTTPSPREACLSSTHTTVRRVRRRPRSPLVARGDARRKWRRMLAISIGREDPREPHAEPHASRTASRTASRMVKSHGRRPPW